MNNEKQLTLPTAVKRAADSFNDCANAMRLFKQHPHGAYTPKRSAVIKNRQRRKRNKS